MTIPTLFHDPTSEPSRAVHWFALETGLGLELKLTWLTRGEHRSPEFLEINPAHQVPALKHGALCLPEASAILLYLAELGGFQERWVGASVVERAHTNRFMSWHHTNTRLKVTLDYVLPVLLMPAYRGDTPPASEEIRRLRDRMGESLGLLDGFVAARGRFLGGAEPSVADLFIASDLFALDIDPRRDEVMDPFPEVRGWLDRLRMRDGYRVSHAPWNAVVPRVMKLVSRPASTPRNPAWVADVCEPLSR